MCNHDNNIDHPLLYLVPEKVYVEMFDKIDSTFSMCHRRQDVPRRKPELLVSQRHEMVRINKREEVESIEDEMECKCIS